MGVIFDIILENILDPLSKSVARKSARTTRPTRIKNHTMLIYWVPSVVSSSGATVNGRRKKQGPPKRATLAMLLVGLGGGHQIPFAAPTIRCITYVLIYRRYQQENQLGLLHREMRVPTDKKAEAKCPGSLFAAIVRVINSR